MIENRARGAAKCAPASCASQERRAARALGGLTSKDHHRCRHRLVRGDVSHITLCLRVVLHHVLHAAANGRHGRFALPNAGVILPPTVRWPTVASQSGQHHNTR